MKIETIRVMGFEEAVRGARNSFNSWDKSDSIFYDYCLAINDEKSDGILVNPFVLGKFGDNITRECEEVVEQVGDDYISVYSGECVLGNNDRKLLSSLIKSGDSHAKALRMVTVWCDITAPRYWWTEFDTYKHTVRCSCSTMHTITKKEFSADDFAFDDFLCGHIFTDSLIKTLNVFRKCFLKSQDKKFLRAIIQILPQSYKQKSTVMLNYQVLRNMYLQRKNHRLSEWHEFCEWVESLPYAKELICV